MDILYFDWMSLVFRWFHVIAGIAWIGASFYFVWLDNNLETPPKVKQESGIKGDLWAFHGGGIYEVAKYTLAPATMPKTLHWFKWEAYTTWITGSILLFIIYYIKADLYLVSSDKWISTPSLGIIASLLFIGSGVLVYESLVKVFAQKNNAAIAGGIIAYIALACYVSVNLFSDRAAYLHVGAMIASIMAASVFFGIIPAQKGFIAAIDKGDDPDAEPMLVAKLRSFHNNYFTLPVIFCMVSNHYSFLYGHEYNWLILISILGITAYARHYFNLKNQGQNKPIILVISVALLFSLIVLTSIDTSKTQEMAAQAEPLSATNLSPETPAETLTTPPAAITDADKLMQITSKHCQNCHSKTPTQAGFATAPLGLSFDSIADLVKSKGIVINAVKTSYMPLGNMTSMTDAERKRFVTTLQSLN